MTRSIRRPLRLALFCGSAIAMFAGVAQAQTDGSGATVAGVVVTGRGVVTTNAVSATKTDTPVIETPQAISVVDHADLVLHNPQDISEAISYSAGVTPNQFGYDPRFSQFQIRGFSEFYNGVFQDGLHLFASNFLGPLLEPYGLQQLDIVRGPTSVLYGQNAPGGLVNLVSKTPQAMRFGELQLQVGNYGRYDGRWDFNSPLTSDGSLLGRFVGVERESGTQYPNTPDDETYLAPSLTWKPREGTSITLLGSYQRVSGGESDQFYEQRLLPKGYPQTVYGGEKDFNRSVQETESVGYQLNQALTSGWSLNQAFRYSHSDVDYRFPNVTGFVSATQIGRQAEALEQTLDAVTLDTNIKGVLQTGTISHTVIVGVDYQHAPQTLDDRVGAAPPLNYFAPNYGLTIPEPTTIASAAHQTADQVGIYGQDQLKFGAHWALTGSVRYDWSFIDTNNQVGDFFSGPKSQDDAAVTGRVGLVYLSDVGLAPYVSYSTSFLPQAGVSFSGQAFDPLRGEQYEVGVRYQPKGGWLSATVSLYDLTENNVLSTDPNLTHTGFQVETGQERSKGVEFELAAHPIPQLNLTAAYTYDDVRITKSTVAAELNSQAQNTPANQGSVFADYTFLDTLLKGFGLGVGVRYVGTSFDSSSNATAFINPSQTYIDALVHYDFARWRAAINVTNLADKEVATCFTGVCNFGRRRQVIGSLAMRF
jgi:iron complex outermembrane receptor protein